MSLERPLLFFHVEKAGGSSIEEVVARHLGAQAVKLPASPAAQLEQGQRGGLNHTVIIPGYFGWSPFLLEATLLRLINHTACAVAFMGHFSVLPLLRLLVQIDRGEMGPVRCRRWRWPRSGDATALAWGALSRSDCVTVLRDPLERARSSWNFFNYAGGSNCRLHCGPTAVGHLRGTSWCADCSPLRFEEAVRVLGARAVLRKTRGNLALHRLGALSGGLASASATADADLDNETASTLARAKCLLHQCRIVGISEQLDAVVRAISLSTMQVPCQPVGNANYNVWSHQSQTSQLSTDDRAELLSLLRFDRELYHLAERKASLLAGLQCHRPHEGRYRLRLPHRGACVSERTSDSAH